MQPATMILPRPCSRVAALWIIGVGVLHRTLFLWLGRATLGAIATEGFWNTIDPIRGRPVPGALIVVGARKQAAA